MIASTFFEQPEYQLFRRAYAERKAPLVVICGSGLSSPAGLPTWPKLRANLQKEVDKKEATINQIGRALLGGKVAAAREQGDIWVAFQLLKEILTPNVFEQLIENELSPAESEGVPRSYNEILRLQPSGLVSLNLDKFAGEALANYKPGELITPVFGKELARKWNLLKVAKTYLVYLHGGLHDPATWVMTQDELREITSNAGHAHFLRTLYTDNLVLFVGVSADDVALSGRLLELTEAGFRPRNLYWLTSRQDSAANRWAADAFVSMIRYDASDDTHHEEIIHAVVEDCLGFISKDELEPPLTGMVDRFHLESLSNITDPDGLAQLPPEEIRKIISSKLDEILLQTDDPRSIYDRYRDFCGKYDFAVHNAFYRGKGDKFRDWFGYKLDMPSLGRGNFGEVYSAKDKDGKTVAVKIMHESIFGNNDMLGGFRRGVRSMQIVTQHDISGMVPILESFELPPTIVMPYVSGHSLQEALEMRSDLPWLVRLKISIEIGKIVSQGHALPQTILHRDLKPSNIMITNFEYQGAFDPEVTVLDFDMSWHKGSKEKDVIFESRDDFGFLAPEQTDPTNRYAARSTRVDSYGYGMTIFYTFGREAPRPNEALSEHWLNRATKAAATGYDADWKSGPNRLARLIVRATEIDQNRRIDFASILHGLESIHSALVNVEHLFSPEVWAEEVLSHVSGSNKYEWDDTSGRGGFDTPSGLFVECIGNFRRSSVVMELRYIDRGVQERSHLIKYLGAAAVRAQRILSDGGWTVIEHRAGGLEAMVRAECDLDSLMRESNRPILAAAAALNEFYL